MDYDRILIGSLFAFLCGLGFRHDAWLLRETLKGRRLVTWLGEKRGRLALRTLLTIGMTIGVLLATGIIQPIEW